MSEKKVLDENGVSHFTLLIKEEFAAKSDVPTNNNQLINGAGYQNASQVETAIQNAIAGVTQFNHEIVASLPATGKRNNIFSYK